MAGAAGGSVAHIFRHQLHSSCFLNNFLVFSVSHEVPGEGSFRLPLWVAHTKGHLPLSVSSMDVLGSWAVDTAFPPLCMNMELPCQDRAINTSANGTLHMCSLGKMRLGLLR